MRARGDALRRFAYLLCGDRHLGEDLVQEVLVKAYRRWHRIESEQPDRYLRTALVRSHVSWLRRRSSSERPGAVAEDRAEVGEFADFADRQAVREEVWARLGTLTRAQRAVLVLRFYEDLDDKQIAEVLRCAPSTVRVHAARGLSRLRTDLIPALVGKPSAARSEPSSARPSSARPSSAESSELPGAKL